MSCAQWTRIFASAAAATLMGMASASGGRTTRSHPNPLFDAADPHAVVINDEVWLYPTWGRGSDPSFSAWHSKDLVNWTRVGPVLKFSDVSWIKADGKPRHHAWAPCLATKNGKFYLYFSVGDQSTTPSRIGVAVGDSPAGPFVDSGKELPCTGGRDKFEAIDPMVFTDPNDGKSYFYAGGSNGSRLRVFELNDDMISFAREVDVKTPRRFTEGAFMHERDGVYYLTYSHGGWRDASYSVHYAIGASPTGPFEYKGAILKSDAKHKGPGHHSLITSPAGQTYIVYHRWNNREGDGPYEGSRGFCIDHLDFNADGTIKPVVITDSVRADSFASD
jgi:beta-xylosidase